MSTPVKTNTLFYGDNLPILRQHIADESVDLVYLDPPFNSNRSYNVLFKDESIHPATRESQPPRRGVLHTPWYTRVTPAT